MFISTTSGEFNIKHYCLKSFPNVDLVFIFKIDTLPLKTVTYFAIQINFLLSKNEFTCFAFQSFVKQTWN